MLSVVSGWIRANNGETKSKREIERQRAFWTIFDLVVFALLITDRWEIDTKCLTFLLSWICHEYVVQVFRAILKFSALYSCVNWLQIFVEIFLVLLVYNFFFNILNNQIVVIIEKCVYCSIYSFNAYLRLKNKIWDRQHFFYTKNKILHQRKYL